MSYQYVKDCATNQSLLDIRSYLLDMTVLQALPSSSLYRVPVLGVQELQQQPSFLATAKKRLREERHPCVNIKNFPPADHTSTHKKNKPLRHVPSTPVETFAMFVREHTNTVMKENPGLDAAAHLDVLKNLWQKCGLLTKRLMK